MLLDLALLYPALRGAALLDREEPAWRDAVAPDRLVMEDCSRCVIGQTFGVEANAAGTYSVALRRLVGDDCPACYGFDVTHDHSGVAWHGHDRDRWDTLRSAWSLAWATEKGDCARLLEEVG